MQTLTRETPVVNFPDECADNPCYEPDEYDARWWAEQNVDGGCGVAEGPPMTTMSQLSWWLLHEAPDPEPERPPAGRWVVDYDTPTGGID